MADDGADYAEALAEAQELGYAEPDPTADVSGADAAAKAAILASLAFGTWVGLDDVYREGIESLTAVDMSFAPISATSSSCSASPSGRRRVSALGFTR